jgi:SMC interacting uncharacterized protein involved in chromosome segregation
LSHNKAEIIKAILTNTTLSEEKKSEIIAEIIEEFQKTYPDLQYHATKADIKEAELKITKEIENIKLEIEQVRKEVKEVEANLTQNIKEVEAKLTQNIKEVEANLTQNIKEVEAKLTKDIKELDLKFTKETKNLDLKIKDTKFSMLKWMFVFWATQMGAILVIIYKLLHS